MAARLAGEGLRSCQLTLHDLKTKFKRHTVSATLQCTGNRRHEINEVRPVQGLDWDVGAISNATWTGVRLSDILEVRVTELRFNMSWPTRTHTHASSGATSW